MCSGVVKTWRRVFHQDRGTEGEGVVREECTGSQDKSFDFYSGGFQAEK